MGALILAISGTLHAVQTTSMSLTGTLPNVNTGATYSGHLTLGGTFTAPVTIDASVGSIPSWMTVTITGTDVAFSGTAPSTAETDAFTVRATDSSATPQVATSPQSVAVSPAAASPTLVHTGSKAGSSSTVSISFSPTPAAGNLLQVTVFSPGNPPATPTATPAGWTRIDGSGQSTARPMQVFSRISDGTETGFTAIYNASQSYGIYYSEWSGATTIAPLTGSSVPAGTSTPTLGPSAAPPVAGALPLFFSTARNSTGKIASVPSGWTLPLADNTDHVAVMTYEQTAPGSAVSETLTLDATTNNFYQWSSTWVY